MDKTLDKYIKQHRKEYPKHKIWKGMNFTHCETCKDHTHYAAPNEVIRHNSDYSIHERIKL